MLFHFPTIFEYYVPSVSVSSEIQVDTSILQT